MENIPPIVQFIESVQDVIGKIDNCTSLVDAQLSFLDFIVHDESCYRYPCNDTIDQLERFNIQFRKLLSEYTELLNNNLSIGFTDQLHDIRKSVDSSLPKLSNGNYLGPLNYSDSCMICLDNFDSGIILMRCGHYLCSDCFKTIQDGWENQNYGCCPYCRKIVSDFEKIEFKKKDAIYNLNIELTNLMISEKINRYILESNYLYQLDLDVNGWFTDTFIFYIVQVETSDRKCILDAEDSIYRQLVNDQPTRILKDFVCIWREADVYQCFYDVYKKIRMILETDFRMKSISFKFYEEDGAVEWLTYQVLKETDQIEKWMEWLRFNVAGIPIQNNFEYSQKYLKWTRKSKQLIRTLIALRLYKQNMESDIGSNKVGMCIDNIPDLISFLKLEV